MFSIQWKKIRELQNKAREEYIESRATVVNITGLRDESNTGIIHKGMWL